MTGRIKTAAELYSAGLEPGADLYLLGRELIDSGNADQIFLAGRNWRYFDYSSGQKKLMESGNCEMVHKAGIFWPSFDYAAGMDFLAQQGNADYIYRAGRFWNIAGMAAHAVCWCP